MEGPNPSGLCMCGCGEPAPLADRTARSRGWVKGQPVKYIRYHNWGKPRTWTVDETTGCWIWDGYRTERDDRGRLSSEPGSRRVVFAYRWVWEQKRGPIPAGMRLHHTCENPACVNPDHLELMTPSGHASEHQRLRRADIAALTSRECARCGEDQPVEVFLRWRSGLTNLAWYCDPCRLEYQRQWGRERRERRAA